MQANWSIILNVLLLIGVIVAIARLMQARRDNLNPQRYQPSTDQTTQNQAGTSLYNDDIIAVRKVTVGSDLIAEETKINPKADNDCKIAARDGAQKISNSKPREQVTKEFNQSPQDCSSIMFFLLAKDNRQFAGYELLQTVLASGLRFGEGQIFHRHQFANGQGPVLCSLAAATASGIFDLQNIGAFSVRGLCLFMQASNNPTIDAERFSIMLDTARQLSEGLDAHLLDDQRKPLTEASVVRYYQSLRIEHLEAV